MEKSRRTEWTGLGLALGSLVFLLAMGHAMAQPKKEGMVNECGTGCAEVTVRYSDDGKVEIVDSKTRRAIPTCRICLPNDAKCANPCKGSKGTLDHVYTIQLLKTHNSPGCTLFCYPNGHCKETCSR